MNGDAGGEGSTREGDTQTMHVHTMHTHTHDAHVHDAHVKQPTICLLLELPMETLPAPLLGSTQYVP